MDASRVGSTANHLLCRGVKKSTLNNHEKTDATTQTRTGRPNVRSRTQPYCSPLRHAPNPVALRYQRCQSLTRHAPFSGCARARVCIIQLARKSCGSRLSPPAGFCADSALAASQAHAIAGVAGCNAHTCVKHTSSPNCIAPRYHCTARARVGHASYARKRAGATAPYLVVVVVRTRIALHPCVS